MKYEMNFYKMIEEVANELCIRERIINKRGEEDYIYHCNLKKIKELFIELLNISIDEYLMELAPDEALLYTYEFDYKGNTFDEDLETDYRIKIDAANRVYNILELLPDIPKNFEYAFSEPFLLGITKEYKNGKLLYKATLTSAFLVPKVIN